MHSEVQTRHLAESQPALPTADSTRPAPPVEVDREKLATAVLAQANAMLAAASELGRRQRAGSKALDATLIPTGEILGRYDRAVAKLQVLVFAGAPQPK